VNTLHKGDDDGGGGDDDDDNNRRVNVTLVSWVIF
jgi:hypothetical protein